MKKLVVFILPLLLAACASSGLDLTNPNNQGLRCSPDANTLPDWDKCTQNAKRICGAQQAVNIQQHPPTGSGNPADAYFISFQCE